MKVLTLAFLVLMCAVTASAQNNPPIAIDDSYEAISQSPVMLDILANDTDQEGDSIWILYVTNPVNCTVEIVDKMVKFTSAPYIGQQASFKYKVADAFGESEDKGLVNVNVLQNPDMPVAVRDTFELMQLLSHELDVLNNDYDPNGNQLKIKSVTGQYNCKVTISQDSLTLKVIPYHNMYAHFKYIAVEVGTVAGLASIPCVVSINTLANPDMPVIMPDSAVTTGGVSIDIPVLDNDYDPQAEEIQIYSIGPALAGNVELTGNNIRYTPPYSYVGADQFYYQIGEIDDTLIFSDDSKVTISVQKNPECPVAMPDTAYGMRMVPITIDILANDYDAENEEVMINFLNYGTITEENKVVIIPPVIGNNPFIFTYGIQEVNDPESYSEDTQVYVYLSDNPALPVGVPDHVTTTAPVPVRIKPLENDILNTADTLILYFPYERGEKGIFTDSLNWIIYTPAYQAEGIDSIFYEAKDGNGTRILRGKIYVNILPGKFRDYLNVNNIEALVNANGYLFNENLEMPGDGLLYNNRMYPHFRFPADSSQSTIFSSNIWIGGHDQNLLHMAGERYKMDGIDFQAGPIADTYNMTHYLKYGRVWKINSDEIDYHRQNFYKSGYEPVEAIVSWPGNGNTELGEAQMLAPYGDFNNDGKYRWQDGDYPLIRGDQTIFFMFNDDVEHRDTNGERLKVEVHGMVYGYDDPSDSALYNSIFVHYDVINRSLNTYHDTYFSVFTDIDLGCAYDDLVGCDVERGSFYAYNGGTSDCNGDNGTYNNHIPAQSVTILAGPTMDEDGLDNESGICNESINGLNFGNQVVDDERYGMSAFSYFNNTEGSASYMLDPHSATQYYNYMTGYWLDSTRFLYGGNGHVSTGAVGPECKFMFPGDSDPLNWGTSCNFPAAGYNQGDKYWTEVETGNAPNDRRGLGIMGPFTFEPGEVEEIELAFCTGYDLLDNGNSLNRLFEIIDTIINAVGNGEVIIPNESLGYEPAIHSENILLYPNPANTIIAIKGMVQNATFNYVIYNLLGLKVSEGYNIQASDKTIDISRLSSGAYIIKITTGEEQKALKFIKN